MKLLNPDNHQPQWMHDLSNLMVTFSTLWTTWSQLSNFSLSMGSSSIHQVDSKQCSNWEKATCSCLTVCSKWNSSSAVSRIRLRGKRLLALKCACLNFLFTCIINKKHFWIRSNQTVDFSTILFAWIKDWIYLKWSFVWSSIRHFCNLLYGVHIQHFSISSVISLLKRQWHNNMLRIYNATVIYLIPCL